MSTYSFGIDISSWQGDIDLQKINPGFVIIRAGCGSRTDAKAVRNMDLCDSLGIPYGVYWYSYALTVEQAREEAQACLAVIKGRTIRVGVWCDMEDADGYKRNHNALRKDLTSAMAYAFADEIEKAGYYSGIYASLSWIQDGYISGCERFDKWVACWGRNTGELTTDTSKYGTLHQYAGDIQKDGYQLDFNVCYVPLSHYDMQKPHEPTEDPQDGDAECPVKLPTLRIGDTSAFVSCVQRQLIAMGYDCGGRKDLLGKEKPDGKFGGKTQAAVMEVQRANKGTGSGIVDSDTWPLILNY